MTALSPGRRGGDPPWGQTAGMNGHQRGSAEPPDPLAVRLRAEQLELLRRYGEIRPTEVGQVLVREGDRGYDFIVLLSGAVTVVHHQAGVERVLATGRPGQFVGELSILTGERLLGTAIVSEPGSVLVVPVDRLRALLGRDQALAELILETALHRRRWLSEARAGLRILGSRQSSDTRRLREFADRNRLPYVWVDPEAEPAPADRILGHHGLGRADTPLVVIPGAEVLRNPSNIELARAAGVGSGPVARKSYDVGVIGAGPAGLAASVYGASEGLATVAVDGLGVGGQIGTTSRIENYLGFPVGVTGTEFADRAFIQALRFGVTLLVPCTATGLSGNREGYVLRLDTGDRVTVRRPAKHGSRNSIIESFDRASAFERYDCNSHRCVPILIKARHQLAIRRDGRRCRCLVSQLHRLAASRGNSPHVATFTDRRVNNPATVG